ncbi:MAG: phosphoadenosine phosphosulfate reductase [Gemmobacter sp.]
MIDEPTITAAPDPAALQLGCLKRLEELGEELGHFEPLGARHWALFVDEGPNLLVTFESLQTLAALPQGSFPVSHAVARAEGWSYLCLIADGPTWYRDARVWGYFDRLIDDGFFEDFDRVTFFGAGMGGHAACAYAVAAPGATVLALRPVATLDPGLAGWDRRHLAARKLDFRSRFGYGPDMIDGAAQVFVLCDPQVDEDAMHAALYRKRFVTRLACPHLGPEPETALAEMGLLEPLLTAAGAGRLDRMVWARLWRARRDHATWLRNMVVRLIEGPSRVREGIFLRAALARAPKHRRMRKRMEELTQILAREGLELPPPRG